MNAAVIVAAGRGTRMGLERNKVLAPLCGEPVIARTVRAFERTGWFDGGIVVVTGACDLCEMKRILADAGLHAQVVLGGADRQESVCRGLAATNPEAQYVAIHDGARPLVTAEVIARTLESAKKYGSGVAAVPLKDTVKRVNEGGVVVDTPPRDALRAVQTPQTFEAELIRRAHAAYALGERATDDAALAERMGVEVRLTEGDVENIKLTTPEDMLLARQVILRREGQKEEKPMVRIGHGYDVHRLTEDRKLILCGVEIPYTLGLLGHSDADVALHALMDALLGAAALGDIGKLFPDSADEFAGISSLELLRQVKLHLAAAGYDVVNIDATILAQAPKLAPYREQMRANIARELQIDVLRVSVKATTEEHLGFTGSGEGMAVHAIALLERADN